MPYLLAVVFCFCCTAAFANPQSPTFVGNFLFLSAIYVVIGLVEGAVLALLFRRTWKRALIAMILANLFSFMVASELLPWLRRALGPLTIYNAMRHGTDLFVLLFVLAVILELPFVFALFARGKNRLPLALFADVTVQFLSYACIAAFFFYRTDLDLLLHTKMSPPSTFVKDPGATLFFLGSDGKTVFRQRVDGGDLVKMGALRVDGPRPFGMGALPGRLGGISYSVRKDESGSLQLFAEGFVDKILLCKNYVPHSVRFDSDGEEGRAYGDSADCIDLRDPGCAQWRYVPLNRDALPHVLNPSTSASISLGWRNYLPDIIGMYGEAIVSLVSFQGLGDSFFMKVFADAPPRPETLPERPKYLTFLPGDQLLFQWGNQICLLDCDTRTFGLVAVGYSPLVMQTGPPSSEWEKGRTRVESNQKGLRNTSRSRTLR